MITYTSMTEVSHFLLKVSSAAYLNKRIASFSISSWNIQGLKSSTFGVTTTSPVFINSTSHTDLIILQETWRPENIPSDCPSNYTGISLPSLKCPHTKMEDSLGEYYLVQKETLQ